jgi:hypothetical protein
MCLKPSKREYVYISKPFQYWIIGTGIILKITITVQLITNGTNRIRI